MTRASIIIVGWNGGDILPVCLRALAAQIGREDELIVVDNASSDGSVDAARSTLPTAKVIVNSSNLGFAGGANVGIRASSGSSFLLVNQDVVVHGGWLEAMLEALRPTQVGVVGSKLLYPDGRIQHAGGTLHYPLALPDHRGYREMDRGQWDESRDVDFVTGAAIAIGRDVIEKVGLFDEGYSPAYYEETDLCVRAKNVGYLIRYAPAAVATHQETTSISRQSTQYHRWMARGRLRFVLKHWSTAQFHEDFLPAERMWGASLSLPEMRDGLRMAYLDTLLALREIPSTGVFAEPESVAAVAEAIVDLRSAMARLSDPGCPPGAHGASGPVPGPPRPDTVQAQAESADWLRSAIQGLRRRVEHKWYLRHLLMRKELGLTQATVTALDRETADAYRTISLALYGLRATIDGLEERVKAVEKAHSDALNPEGRS